MGIDQYKIFRCAIVTILFLMCLFFQRINCQICTKRVIVTRWQQQPYQYTYRETYHGQCWYGCIKTRIATIVDYKTVPRKVIENRQICCEGYRDVSSVFGSIDCQPICMPACINGHCLRPSVCECNDGYAINPDKIHSCEPVCLNDCLHGSCISPNHCQCDSGYKKINETCEPICTEPCENGVCIAPDTCECWPGYRRTENNTCEPYCFSGCPNGYCISPDTCHCNNGWVRHEENDTCVPYCTNPCGNGTCVSPNTCECFRGYEIDASYNDTSNTTVCVPSCNNCINGSCTAPNECTCETPFIPKFISKTKSGCPNSYISCGETICVMDESTTTIYSTSDESTILPETYDQSSFYEYATKLTSDGDFPSSFDVSTRSFFEQEIYSTEKEPITANETETNKYKLSREDKKEDKTKVLIYATALSLTLVAILIIIVVARRNSIANWMKGGSYIVQDQGVTDISTPTQATVDMNMTSPKK